MNTAVRRRLIRLLAVMAVVTLSHNTTGAQEASTLEPAGNFSGSLSHDRDRAAERTLERARGELTTGDIAAAVRHLQDVLDADADTLVLTAGVYRSAWDVAATLLRELPARGRATYERSFGPVAQEELALALQSGSDEAVRRVARRYQLTLAGQKASLFLAVLAWDRGEQVDAARWRRLIDTDANVVQRLGINDRVLQLIDKSTVGVPETDPSPTVSVDEPVWSPKHSWRADVELTNEARQEIADSLSEMDAQAVAPWIAAKPIVHEGRVFTRQLGRLMAVEAGSGTLLWQRKIDSPAARLIEESTSLQNPLRRGSVMALFLQRLVRSSLLDRLSTDGTRLFAVIANPKLDPHANTTPPRNMLAALSVDDGRLLWRAGGKFGSNDSDSAVESSITFGPELSDVFFLGTPQMVGHWSLVLGQRGSMVLLLALDAESGQLEWSVRLGQAVRTLAEDKPRQGTSCRVRVHNDRVYCPTAAGSLACVDLMSRRLLWSVRYPRDDIPDPVNTGVQPRDSSDLTRHMRLPTRDVWNELFLHVSDDRVLLASPDADRLFAFDATDGHVLWTRPRGDGLLVAGPVDERLIILGKHQATSLAIADGREVWTTAIELPAGSGFFTDSQYVFPTLSGGIQSLALNDGRMTELTERSRGPTVAQVGGHPISVSIGPPRRLRPVQPRNLVLSHGVVLEQTFSQWGVVTTPGNGPPVAPLASHAATREDATSADSDSGRSSTSTFAADLKTAVAHVVHRVAFVRREIGAVEAALRLTERYVPLLKSPDERAASLISELAMALQNVDRPQALHTLQRLLRQPVRNLFVRMESPHRVVRLDRWLPRGLSEAITTDAHERVDLWAVMDRLIEDIDHPLLRGNDAEGARTDTDVADRERWDELCGTRRWGTAAPRITETDESSVSDNELYVNTVPLTVTADSPWEWVTVQLDRTGRDVFFHRADLAGPVIIRLPQSSRSPRMMTGFLHAWANGPLLCLRVGTELFGFRINEADGSLPQAPSWPSRGEHRSLVGERAPIVSVLQESSPALRPLWNDSLPGYFDMFGRQFAEVGPVCATCVCYWDRGHLMALDPVSGAEMWSRSGYPVGTHCVGDAERLVILRDDTTEVEVVRSVDGQTVAVWDWQELQKDHQRPAVTAENIVAVQGTLALYHSQPPHRDARYRMTSKLDQPAGNVTVMVIDLATGTSLWSRPVSADVWSVRIDNRVVALVDPGGSLTLWDWRSGDRVAEHEVSLPDEITSVEVITHASEAFVAVSGRPDDKQVFGTQQIHGSRRRPIVEGWLHALSRSNGELLWETRLENIGLPLDQPRHVPLLVANYVQQGAASVSSTGVLRCFDRRTGELVYEHTRPNHVYHTLHADAAHQRVDLQLRKQTVRFEYAAKP